MNNNNSPLQSIENYYPVLIVGAGITGAGIFRDLCLHNIPTLLIDKCDFSSQTSQSSSKMLHGGIRYLENLHFDLVQEALKEKKLWLKLAPHLAKSQEFHIPVFKDDIRPLWMIKLGVLIYNLLDGEKVTKSSGLSKEETLKYFPHLTSHHLKGCAVYSDAIVDDAKLALEVIYDGLVNRNSKAINYVSIDKVSEISESQFKVTLKDELTQLQKVITCNEIVFATGPFSDKLFKELNFFPWSPKLIPSKGSHLWMRPESLNITRPMLLTPKDGRVIFVIPHGNKTLVGTTESHPQDDYFNIQPSTQEVEYLLNNLREYFPKLNLGSEDIISTFSGIRPLIKDTDSNKLGKVARVHKLFQPHSRVRIILGGKYTTFRVMAKDITQQICHKFNLSYNSELTKQNLRVRSVSCSYNSLSRKSLNQCITKELPRKKEDIIKRRMGQLNLTNKEIELIENHIFFRNEN